MKYFRFLLLFPVLFISSCTEKYYITEEVIMNTETGRYPVRPNDWIKIDNFPGWNGIEDSGYTYFYCDFGAPVLTNWFLRNGIMNAYLEVLDGNLPVLIPLPFDNYYRDNYEWLAWTEQVTCEFSFQNARFILKYNDFDVERPPLAYTFVVRYAW